MDNKEVPKLFPNECLVPVDGRKQNIIIKAIAGVYEYGVDVLLAKGYPEGRVKVFFPEVDATITMLISPGRQPSRTPLRFHKSESGITILKQGSVTLGVIPAGVIIKPTIYDNQPVQPLHYPQPELIVNKLIYYFESYPPVIDVEKQIIGFDHEAREIRKWESINHEVLKSPLRDYFAGL